MTFPRAQLCCNCLFSSTF